MAHTPGAQLFDAHHLPPGVEPPSGEDPRELGPYRIVGRIGAGGMGAVYAGITGDGTRSALKVVHPHFAVDPEFLARFAREVDLVSRVRATCTPEFHGADLDAETPWLATEYVPGPTLRQYVRDRGPLSGGMLTALATGLAEALVVIHGAGVVHRDLKPGNVIMAPNGPKVLDFGIARALEGTALTQTGGLLGTPGWMAPEQYEGAEASPSSDMFAWAALVFFAAVGREPFGRGPLDVVAHRTRNEEPDLTGLPEHLVPLVRAGLGRDPRRRPTAEQALAELTGEWTKSRAHPGAQSPVGTVPAVLEVEWRGMQAPEPRRTRRSRSLILLPVAAVTAVALVGSWFLLGPEETAVEPEEPTETEEDVLAVEANPEDVTAVVEDAVELALEASSFESSFSVTGTEIGDPPHQEYRYTEDPEPIYWQSDRGGPYEFEIIEIGEGPDDVIRNTVRPVEQAGFYRDPADAAYDTRREMWVLRLEELGETVESAEEITYEGITDVGDPAYMSEELLTEREADSRTGHHYSGVLPFEAGGDFPDDEHLFHLWVGEDGHPQYLHVFEFWEEEYHQGVFPNHISTDLRFEQFGEPVEVEIPDESEIRDGR